MVKCRAFRKGDWLWNHSKKGYYTMAKCAHCGKATTFGHKRSFSQHATNRKFKPNLQKVSLLEKGNMVQVTLCTKCIRTLAKTTA